SLPTAIDLAERGLVPTRALRAGIRAICRRRLREQSRAATSIASWIDQMRAAPIALETRAANDQHYEMPPEFFELVLGPQLKYSGAYWPDGVSTLAGA